MSSFANRVPLGYPYSAHRTIQSITFKTPLTESTIKILLDLVGQQHTVKFQIIIPDDKGSTVVMVVL